MEKKDIIIGAGISGLSCGSVLRDECIIVEKSSHAGGLAATKEFRSFRFDLGGHRFYSEDKSLNDFIQGLLPDEMVEVRRKSTIFRNGKFLDYPLRMSVVFHLNPLDILSTFVTYLRRQLLPLQESSFEEAAINRFGERLYRLFFKNYTEKVWGLECRALSKELAEVRLQDVSLKKVIMCALFKTHKEIKSFTESFLYPKRGIGEIAERLSRGLDIRLDSEVTGFVRSHNRIKSVIINDLYDLECSHIVSTMPITRLAALLEAPEAVQRFSKDMRYRSMICVFLVLKRKRYTDNHWIYFSENQIFGRLHEPKNWSSLLAPEDKTGICVELFCNSDSDVWKMTDAEIAHQVIRDLPLLEKFEVDDHCVERLEYAYPIYDIHFQERLDAVREFLASYENLFILGRTGAFKYISMDTCVDDGLRLGNLLKRKEPRPKVIGTADRPAFIQWGTVS